MIRLMKSAMVLCVALLCLFHATQNVANLGVMYGNLEYVLSNQDHAIYANSFGPSITAPFLIWLAVAIVLVGEFGAGLIALVGAWQLLSNRGKSAEEFNKAKTLAIVGCGMGVLVWFGLFMTIGGAFFQMWQTAAGDNSHTYSHQFVTAIGVVLLFVNMRDD